jgi:hypothetical protein
MSGSRLWFEYAKSTLDAKGFGVVTIFSRRLGREIRVLTCKPYQVDQVIAALERLKAKQQAESDETISRSEKGETHGAE